MKVSLLLRRMESMGWFLKTDSGIGLINMKGEIIAEPKYNSIEYVRENIAIVSFDDYYYLYDFVKEKKLKRLEEIRIEEALIADEPRCN